MDRISTEDIETSTEVPVAAVDSGWDARTVWKERVRGSGRAGAAASGRPEPVPPGAGWDPIETWRQRVSAPRRERRS